jgi:hypothetical protein
LPKEKESLISVLNVFYFLSQKKVFYLLSQKKVFYLLFFTQLNDVMVDHGLVLFREESFPFLLLCHSQTLEFV